MNRFSSLIITAAFLTCLASCGKPGSSDSSSSSDTSSASPSENKPTIALVMKSLANEFFLTMENGAKAHQQAHADQYELITVGTKDELDVNRQVQLVEQMIARPVNAIVIAPADSKALVGVCKKACDAGITVVNIDNRLDEQAAVERGLKVPFVGPDNRKGARLAGEYLAAKLSPGDPVAIIEGVPTTFNAQQRKLGFEDAINAAGLQIATSQSASWEMDKANQLAAAIISENPGIKAFLCANDSMALGTVSALRAANLVGTVLVVGFDNISATKQLIDSGSILATVDQHADQLAVFGIEYALDMLNSKATPDDRETPVDLITKETLISDTAP